MQQNQINNNTAMICIDFDLIYSDEVGTSITVVDEILKLWDLGNGRNVIRLA